MENTVNLKDHLLSKGYDFEPEHLDGAFREYKTDTVKGWYIGSEIPGKGLVFTWGNWKTGERFSCSIGWSGSDSERDKVSAEIESVYRERKKKKNAITKKRAQKEWEATQSIGASDYLNRKGLSDLNLESIGVKTTPNQWGKADLLIPMRDSRGELWNLQRIQPDGFKTFMPGGKTDELFFVFPPTCGPNGLNYICEGFATASSIYLSLLERAIPASVICAFSSANLEPIAKLFPNSILCADNDKTVANNPGLSIAKDLLERGLVASVRFPVIEGLGSDFNDLWCVDRGSCFSQLQTERTVSDIVQVIVQSQPKTLNTEEKSSVSTDKNLKNAAQCAENTAEIVPKNTNIGDTNEGNFNKVSCKPKAIEGDVKELFTSKKRKTELEIVDLLLQEVSEDLVTCGPKVYDIFKWTGTHWKNITDWEIGLLTRRIVELSGGEFSQTKAESATRMLVTKLPFVDRNMHDTNPYAINLRNGTFHIIGKTAPYKLDFLPHSKKDFLNNVIDVDYIEGAKNQEFTNILDRITGNAPDKLERIRAIRQMFGACLAPIFPKLFMLHGKTDTGKTVIIKLLCKLINDENISRLSPTDMKGGFEMEALIGKLVNLDTDIEYTEIIRDSVIKKISDRTPISINRKGRKYITAHIPAIHIWAGNDIPGTLDRGSGAMNKRWIFLRFDNHVRGLGDGAALADVKFEDWVWDLGPSGILNFALEGLKDLLEQGGRYFDPPSSIEDRGTWAASNDRIAHFVEDIENGEAGEIGFIGEGDDKSKPILRSQFWEAFCQWHVAAFGHSSKLGKIKFFETIKKREFTIKSKNWSKENGETEKVKIVIIGFKHCQEGWIVPSVKNVIRS
jgi:phage/plasmid-associated DNA primase/phage/plasmid primase-like uncharacterized protein